MSRSGITLKALAGLIFALALCSTTQAQNRFFVSGLGSDTNACTRTAPCRTFQKAHDVAASGGEVVALDPAGYGQLTIAKSISIIGDRVYAGISASSGNAITIATAGITVTLRSLTIEGLGTGERGVYAMDFAALHIENCIVNGFANEGVFLQPSGAGNRKAFIKDSIFRNNVSHGLFLNNGNGTTLVATVENSRTEKNQLGMVISGAGATVTVRDCLSSGNAGVGLTSQLSGVLNVESSVVSNNGGAGFSAGIENVSGTVRVSHSTITNNSGFGFLNSVGTFESRGNNTVAGNNGGGAQTSGTISPMTGI